MSDIKSKGIKAFIWDLIGTLGTHASSFIVMIFLARLLEPSDFGAIAIIMVIVSIATVFSDIGLGGALIQRRKVLPIHYSSVFFFNIAAGLSLTLLAFFSAPWIADFYKNPQLLPLIQVMSLLFVISAFHSVQSVILRKALNYELLTKVNLIASIASGFIGVALAYSGAGVWSLAAQLLSREIIINIVIWSKTSWLPSFSFSLKALKQLWSYGMHMFLAGLLDTIFDRADYMIMGRLFSAATLGYFHQAKQLNQFVIQYSAGSLMSVLFPVLSKIQNDLEKFKRVIIKSLGVINFVTFLMLGGLYLVADELILLLFGPKWIASIVYFKILIFSGFAYPISALMVNVLSSRGQSKKFLRLEIYKKMITVMSLLVLYVYGINAFLYSLVISSLFGTSLNIYFATREIGLSFMKIAKPILIQMALTVTIVIAIQFLYSNLQLADILMLFIKGMSFLVAYVFINWFFKIESFEYFYDQFKSLLDMLKIKRKVSKEC